MKLRFFKHKEIEKTKSNLLKSYSEIKIKVDKKLNKLLDKDIDIDLKGLINKPKELLETTQDWLEKKVTNETEEIHLKESKYWAQRITWTLMGGSLFAVVWLSFAQTEEIIVVKGNLEPINKVIDIQMPIGGVIKELFVKEGEIVEKGTILFKLDSEISESRLKSSKKSLDINNDILNRLKYLKTEGAISEMQYLQQMTKVAELKGIYTKEKVTTEYQIIKTPITGKVFDMKPKREGYVAQASEPIMKIVPMENLRLKIEIDSRKIGFVKVNKPVDISIDSFPASDFGVVTGKVSSIGSDALPPNPQMGKDYRFPAIVTMNKQYLKVKGGKKLPLQTGMSATANIKLRKVSYLQLLLNTFQDKAKSLSTI